MRKNFLNLFVTSALLLGFTACDSDNNQDYHDSDQPTLVDSIRYFATCEGNYTRGNASITAIMNDGSVRQNLFQSINGRPLGDVAQSMSLIDDNFYIVLNNSAKVEVVDDKQFKSQATILLYNSRTQPRYICGIGGYKAVLTDATCDSLRIIDTRTFEIVRRIYVGSPTNQMTAVGTKLFIKAGNETLIYNTATDNFTKLNFSATADSKMVVDKSGYLWLLTTDDNGTLLIKIDPTTEQIVLQKRLDQITVDQWGARISILDNTIYFSAIDSNYKSYICKYSIQSDSYSLAFTPTEVTYLYGMDIVKNNFVICDAVDFSQSGYLIEMTPNGEVINKFKAGISPNFIYDNK